MIVPSMTLEEKLAHARADQKKVINKFSARALRLEHAFKTGRSKKPLLFHASYVSPNRNNWLVTVRVTKGQVTFFTLVWWQYPGKGLEALHVKPMGETFYLDTHFFQRYRERSSAVPGVMENLRYFFERNHDIRSKRADTLQNGQPAMSGVVADGLILGTFLPGDIISCNTFLAPDDLSEKNSERLNDVNRTLAVLCMPLHERRALLEDIDQQLALLDQLDHIHAQDAGDAPPGMAGGNKQAA